MVTAMIRPGFTLNTPHLGADSRINTDGLIFSFMPCSGVAFQHATSSHCTSAVDRPYVKTVCIVNNSSNTKTETKLIKEFPCQMKKFTPQKKHKKVI